MRSKRRQTSRHHPADRGGNDSILIVGCGCSHRRDDQIGLRIVDCLSENPLSDVRILKTESPGSDLLTELPDVKLLIVVDAARSTPHLRPGSWRKWIVPSPKVPTCESLMRELAGTSVTSSHTLGLGDALMLGEALGLLPPEIWVYGVAAEEFGFGEGCTASAEAAIRDVAARIRADVGSWRTQMEPVHA